MEEADVGAELEEPVLSVEPGVRHEAGRPGRLVLRGAVLGIIAAIVGKIASGTPAAIGAFAGSLAASVYAWGYLRSHLGRADRTHIFDLKLARHSIFRIAALSVVAAGMWMMGRMSFIGYLAGFAVSFAVLIGFEAPAVIRQLRANGWAG